MAQEIYHRSEWGNPNEQWGNVYLNADLTNELYKRASEYENSWVTDQLLNRIGTKPSIILTPTAYEDGLLNSVKPKGGENLLLHSNQFDTTWTNVNTTETGGQSDKDGGTNAWLLSKSATSARIEQSVSQSGVLTFSVYAKAGTLNWVRLNVDTAWAYYDLANGVVGSDLNNIIDHNIYNVGGGWYRCELVINLTTSICRIYPAQNDGDVSGTSGNIYIQDAQLERGLKANTYIETTTTEKANGDFNFSRGSSATRVNEKGLVQDVQLLSGELVQNGDFEEIGSELVTNGGFDNSSSWGMQSSWSISNGSANYNGVSSHYIEQSNVFSANTFYKITFTISNNTSGIISIRDGIATTLVPNTNYTNGTHTLYVKSNTNTTLRIYGVGGSGTLSIDNVSVKEVGQNWEFGGEAIIDNGLVSFVSPSNTYSYIRQDISSLSASVYRISVEVKNYVSGAVQVGFSGSSPNLQNLNVSTDGVYTVELSPNANGDDLEVSREFGGGAFDFDIDNISVIEITDDTDLPRINYTNFDYENGVVVPYSGEGSLLLEPQSTNLLTYSEDFSNASWSKTNGGTADVAAVTGDYAISPDGTQNASRVVFNLNGGTTINDYSRIRQLNVLATTPTLSLFVKSNNTNTYQLNLSYGGGDVGLVTANPNEWSRVEVQTTASGSFDYRLELRGGITNDDTADVLIWGAQAEALSYATSYIPTNGSTVTRLADVCNNSGNSDLINSTEGVLYAEISALADDLTFRSISINANDTRDDQVMIRYRINSNVISFFIRDGGSVTLNKNVIVQDITEYNKVALKYKNGDISGWINGVEYITSTATGIPSGLSKIGFQLEDPNVDPFFGNVKCVAVFKEALSDTELQKLTTI